MKNELDVKERAKQTALLIEIMGQLFDPNGYPFDPMHLERHLQDAISGEFHREIIDLDNKFLFVDHDILPKMGFNVGKNKGHPMVIYCHPPAKGIIPLDLSKVKRVNVLTKNEDHITGKEFLKRLTEQGKISLNARHMEKCWDQYKLMPSDWHKHILTTFFFGTIFLSTDGEGNAMDPMDDNNLYVSFIRLDSSAMGSNRIGIQSLAGRFDQLHFAACVDA